MTIFAHLRSILQNVRGGSSKHQVYFGTTASGLSVDHEWPRFIRYVGSVGHGQQECVNHLMKQAVEQDFDVVTLSFNHEGLAHSMAAIAAQVGKRHEARHHDLEDCSDEQVGWVLGRSKYSSLYRVLPSSMLQIANSGSVHRMNLALSALSTFVESRKPSDPALLIVMSGVLGYKRFGVEGIEGLIDALGKSNVTLLCADVTSRFDDAEIYLSQADCLVMNAVVEAADVHPWLYAISTYASGDVGDITKLKEGHGAVAFRKPGEPWFAYKVTLPCEFLNTFKAGLLATAARR